MGNVCNALSLDSTDNNKKEKDKKENIVIGKIFLMVLNFLLNRSFIQIKKTFQIDANFASLFKIIAIFQIKVSFKYFSSYF